jgi:UDP-N-acetylmuramate dehydrogenase
MNAGTAEREVRQVVERIEFMDPETGCSSAVEAADLRWQYRALENPGVILGATFATRPGDAQEIRERMARDLERRRATQPVSEPSCGSVFKNPPGDYAGRLIEAAGLKGAASGGAQISELHANFIVTRGRARAVDVWALIERARSEVARRFGRELELEVHVLGEVS